jgi:hypothetical protein
MADSSDCSFTFGATPVIGDDAVSNACSTQQDLSGADCDLPSASPPSCLAPSPPSAQQPLRRHSRPHGRHQQLSTQFSDKQPSNSDDTVLESSSKQALVDDSAEPFCYEVSDEEFNRLLLAGTLQGCSSDLVDAEKAYEVTDEEFERLLQAGQLKLAAQEGSTKEMLQLQSRCTEGSAAVDGPRCPSVHEVSEEQFEQLRKVGALQFSSEEPSIDDHSRCHCTGEQQEMTNFMSEASPDSQDAIVLCGTGSGGSSSISRSRRGCSRKEGL